MRINEITQQEMREEYPQHFLYCFDKNIVDQHQLPYHTHKLQSTQRWLLKLSENVEESHIGIFDQDKIVAYVYLQHYRDGRQVGLTTTDPQYRGQGIIRYAIEYATNRYKKVYSDFRQTADARAVWTALIRNPNNSAYYCFDVTDQTTTLIRYDKNNHTMSPDPWELDNDDIIVLATTKDAHPNTTCMIQERAEMNLKYHRPDRLLGPGFNFFNP